jgi:hypothetical protein
MAWHCTKRGLQRRIKEGRDQKAFRWTLPIYKSPRGQKVVTVGVTTSWQLGSLPTTPKKPNGGLKGASTARQPGASAEWGSRRSSPGALVTCSGYWPLPPFTQISPPAKRENLFPSERDPTKACVRVRGEKHAGPWTAFPRSPKVSSHPRWMERHWCSFPRMITACKPIWAPLGRSIRARVWVITLLPSRRIDACRSAWDTSQARARCRDSGGPGGFTHQWAGCRNSVISHGSRTPTGPSLTPHFIVSVTRGLDIAWMRSMAGLCCVLLKMEPYDASKWPPQCKRCYCLEHSQHNGGYEPRCTPCRDLHPPGKCVISSFLSVASAQVNTAPTVVVWVSGKKEKLRLKSESKRIAVDRLAPPARLPLTNLAPAKVYLDKSKQDPGFKLVARGDRLVKS